MRIAFRQYFRMMSCSVFGRRAIPEPQRRGWLFLCLFFIIFPLITVFHACCLAADYLVFPRFRRTPIREPLFIVGNPRSGTTLLHRLLARDPQMFAFKTWELMFPALVQRAVLSALAWCDARIGRPFEKGVRRWESARLSEFNQIHEIGLYLPEEDEKLLMHLLATPDAAFLFPYGGLERYAFFDRDIPLEERSRILNFYTACIRRQSYWTGRGSKRLLSKNPSFTGKLGSLRDAFPDARFILLVRNPLEVIPSAISLARSLIVNLTGKEPESDLDALFYEIIKYYYLEAPRELTSLPDNQVIVVNYDDLKNHPLETLRSIYSRLRMDLTPEAEAAFAEEVDKIRQHRSRHQYSLGNCSISREQILADLAPVFEQFSFDRKCDGRPPIVEEPAASFPRPVTESLR